ncbi:autotransporter outer membrane beta-barrel domain-containing protein [Piscirickettsia salmonis EM-90]|nr:autotransporter outer membrane beta-barrel domain-containing protein [Piscirickettsia salmonis EM-90]
MDVQNTYRGSDAYDNTGGSEKYINYTINLVGAGHLIKSGTEYPILNGSSVSNHDDLEKANFNGNITYIDNNGNTVNQLPLIEFFSRPGSGVNNGSVVLVSKVKSTCDFIEGTARDGLENVCKGIDNLSDTYSSSDSNIAKRVLEKAPVLTSVPVNVNNVYINKVLAAKRSSDNKSLSTPFSGVSTGAKVDRGFSPWIDAYTAHETEDPADGYDGYTQSIKGVSFGIDYNTLDKFGLFFSYSENRFTTEMTNSTIKSNSYGITFFLEKSFKDLDYYSSFSYFFNDFNNERTDTSKSVNSFQSSFSNHSVLFNNRFLYGFYPENLNNYDLKLFFDVNYSQVMGYDYQEDYLNLGGQSVQVDTWHQLNFGIGLSIDKEIKPYSGIITPAASFKIQYSVLNDPSFMNVSSVDFPGSIQVQSVNSKKLEYDLGVALKYEYKDNVELILEYNSIWGNSRKEVVSMLAKYRF